MYKSTNMGENPLIAQDDPLADSMKNDKPSDDLFIGRGDKKLSVKDIRKKMEEWSKKIDLSDITKPDCENTVMPTRSICCAYIVFVIISLLGLIGIFIWKYCRGMIKNNGTSEQKDDSEVEA